MQVISKISIDLKQRVAQELVNAVQNDSNTRVLKIQLFDGGTAWTVPSGVTIALGYRKSDGKNGVYDTLPNGQAACSASGNTVTIILAKQVLTTPGMVNAIVTLHDAAYNQLSTIPFFIRVHEDPAADAIKSDDYYNYTSWEELSNAADAWFAEQDARIAETLDEINQTSATAIVETARGEVIILDDSADLLLRGLKVFGKTTQNGTPAPDAPVPLESVGDSVTVTVCGHNMFDEMMETGHINAETGEAYTDSSRLRSVNYIPILPATKYYLYISGTDATIRYYDSDKNYIGYGDPMWHSQNRVVTTPENARFMRLVLSAAYGTVYRNNIAFNYPETVTEYEPYVSGGSVTVSTPVDSSGNSLYLPGIPVNSGGNYTDSSGQQWLCDEVDFEKGVYVQRVGTIVFDGSDDETWHADTAAGWGTNSFYTFWNGIAKNIYESLAVCSHYKVLPRNSYNNTLSDVVILSDVSITVVKASSANTVGEWRTWLSANPVTLNAVLLNPIEHALPADQLVGYAALHSNYHNTTVFNDRNAGMEVQYVADTKLYIDENVAELVDLIMDIETGGSVSEEQVAQVVEEVLEEHPKLKALEEGVKENAKTLETGYIGSDTEITTTWALGAINSANGANVDDMHNRVRSNFIPTDKGLIVSVLGNNAEFCPVYYDASKQFVGSPGAYQTTDLSIGTGEDTIAFVRLMIRNRTAVNATLTADYGSNIGLVTNSRVKAFYTAEETKDAIVETMQEGSFEQESNAITTTWAVGAIDTSKGIDNNTMNSRLRCDYISTANGLNVTVLGNNAEFCPVYYDKDYKYISSPGAYQKTNLQIAPNTNTAFVRLMIRNSTATSTALAVSYGANIGLTSVTPIKIMKKVYYPAGLSGKKIVFLGDSIPHGQSYAGNIPVPYPQVVADNLGMMLVNYGIGGSTIAQQTNYGGAFRSKTDFDYASKDTSKYYQVITGQTYTTYAYTNGAWTTSDTSLRTPISARYSFMDNDAEIVCVHCTTNDFQYNWTDVGTFEDTGVNTYYGALHTLIKGLMQKYEGKTIFFITPLKRAQDPYTTATSVNGKGKTLKEYRDILMEVCAYYGIPVIDAWANSGLNPYLAFQADMWDSVLTHPLQKGHKLLGDMIASQILAIKRFATP